MARKYLPPEILLEIFSYLDPVENQMDLMSICRASREFNEIAQPRLFEVYSKKGCCLNCSPKARVDDSGPLALFARSLLCRPDLRKVVHRLAIRASKDGLQTRTLWPEVSSPETLKVIDDGIQKLKIGDETKSDYSMTFRAQDIGTTIAILFAILPSLTELNITFNQKASRSLMAALYSSTVEPLCMLNLTSVSLTAYSDGFNLASILPLMSLPRLQYFGASDCVGDYRDIPNSGLPRGLMNFSTLSLGDCCLDRTALRSLMIACKSLKAVAYMTCGSLIEGLDRFPVSADDLNWILGSQKHNLTQITAALINTDLDYWDRGQRAQYDPFTPFTALKYLQVEQGYLLEIPDLPESLETLVLDVCDEPVLEMLCYLVEENYKTLPNLTQVILKPAQSPCTGILDVPPFTEEEFYGNSTLRAAFEAGVQEVEKIANDGCFLLFVECDMYQACLNDDDDEGFSEDDEEEQGEEQGEEEEST